MRIVLEKQAKLTSLLRSEFKAPSMMICSSLFDAFCVCPGKIIARVSGIEPCRSNVSRMSFCNASDISVRCRWTTKDDRRQGYQSIIITWVIFILDHCKQVLTYDFSSSRTCLEYSSATAKTDSSWVLVGRKVSFSPCHTSDSIGC